MNTSLSMPLSLVVLALICGTTACQRRDVPTNAEASTTRSMPQSRTETYQETYLIPFLNEVGTPVACVSEFWPHAMLDECMNEPGVPFKARLPLTLAIWSQGTVIWRDSPNGREAEYCEATVPQETVAKLVDAIDLKEYSTPDNVRYSEEAITWHLPASVIMISKGGRRLFVGSQLESMELLKEYWVWKESELMTFPFSRYSFDEFCKHLPVAYSRHLRQFAGLRTQLKAILPTTGRRIMLQDRVLWTVTTPGKNSHQMGERDKSEH
jgi:hypothetical protein